MSHRKVKIRANILVKTAIPDEISLQDVEGIIKQMIRRGDFRIKSHTVELMEEWVQ